MGTKHIESRKFSINSNLNTIKHANNCILAINGRHNPNHGSVEFVLQMKIIRKIYHIEQHTPLK